jgi:hypothetical protein
MKLIALIAAAVLSTAQTAPRIAPGTLTPGDIAIAVGALPRFTPDRFVSLPPTVREAFTAINCQVPQTNLSAGPGNVITGEFAAKGQRDWAALCSNGSSTEIRVVWGGPARCEDRLAARQDSDSLVATAPGYYSYGRSIAVGARGSQDVIDDTVVNGPRAVHACIGDHWQAVR